MSNWKKRQALASDQQSWRGMGVDSALWTSIDRNAGNVHTALGGNDATATTGIVTDIKFTRTGTAASLNPGPVVYYVSDPSSTGVPVTGINQFSTTMDPSHNVLGTGLSFNAQYFGSLVNTSVGQDVSAVKISILDGGSGYSVGQTFSMNAAPLGAPTWTGNFIGQITGVTSTAPVQGRN